MTCYQKLLSLCLLLLVTAALCPGAHYTSSKRGGTPKGRSSKAPHASQGLSKQSLKWAAAAAGMLGGTGTGYGLGFLGRPKHGSRGHVGTKVAYTDQHHYGESQKFNNQSRWRVFIKAAAPPADINNLFITLGHAVTFIITIWMGTL